MTTMAEKIKTMKRLNKRINAWSRIANAAEKIAKCANTKLHAYTCEQNILISNLAVNEDTLYDEAKKEYNRQNFEFDL